jgi:hypothetical protein
VVGSGFVHSTVLVIIFWDSREKEEIEQKPQINNPWRVCREEDAEVRWAARTGRQELLFALGKAREAAVWMGM